MKNIQLLCILGEVYDKFVTEARSEKKKIKRLWFRVGGIAATVLVVVGIVFAAVINMPQTELFYVENGTIVGVTNKMAAYLRQNDGQLTVSGQIDGLTVTQIGEYAFQDCTALKSVVIDKSITSVGFGAFEGCSALETISVPFVGVGKTDTASVDDGFVFASVTKEEDSPLKATNNSHFGYIFGAETYEENKEYVPDSLADVTVSGNADIKEYAFYQCSGIETVELPQVPEVANNAFEGCSCVFVLKMPGIDTVVSLNAVDNLSNLLMLLAENLCNAGTGRYKNYVFENGALIDDDYSYFKTNAVLDSVNPVGESELICGRAIVWGNSATVIPTDGTVEIIGASAFAGSSVKELYIPKDMILLDYAFSGCRDLTTVVFENGRIAIEGYRVFEDCIVLRDVTLPDTLADMGCQTFYGCRALKNIQIPSGVTVLRNGVFQSCGFEQFVVPDWVTKMEDYVFSDCRALKKVFLPDSVMQMGVCVFYGCDQLKEVRLSSYVVNLPNYTFLECTSLETVEIPDTVLTVGYSAFYRCSSLKTVNLSDSLVRICDFAFAGCSSLTSVTLPAMVTELDERVFTGCTALETVCLPGSVTMIGSGEFDGCQGLSKIILPDVQYGVELNLADLPNLQEIVYAGTVEDAVQYLVGHIRFPSYNITIICADGSYVVWN